jgi:uncharacterized protein YndB with AHSA1/START domain
VRRYPHPVHEAVVESVIDTPVERVWAALTEPAALAAWFWPWQPVVSFSPAVGAAYALEAMHPQAGRLAVSGTVVAVRPPRVLALTWKWADEPDVTSVEITLAEDNGTTTVTVRHAEVASAGTAADYRVAWTDLLARLAGYLAAAT